MTQIYPHVVIVESDIENQNTNTSQINHTTYFSNDGSSPRMQNIKTQNLKSVLKGDLFSVVIWLPFIIQKIEHKMSKFNKFFLLTNIYIFYLFMVIGSFSLSCMITYSVITKTKFQYLWEFDIQRIITFIIASIILILSVGSEIVASLQPVLFWWRIISFEKWNFKYETITENHIHIQDISAPFWNTIIRFFIVITSQILVYLFLLISALGYIYASSNVIDIIKDSLAFVFILQIDEIIFQYLLSVNIYFKKIWLSDITLTFAICKKNKKYYLFNMFITSIFSIFTVIFIFSLIINKIVINFQFGNLTHTPTI